MTNKETETLKKEIEDLNAEWWLYKMKAVALTVAGVLGPTAVVVRSKSCFFAGAASAGAFYALALPLVNTHYVMSHLEHQVTRRRLALEQLELPKTQSVVGRGAFFDSKKGAAPDESVKINTTEGPYF